MDMYKIHTRISNHKNKKTKKKKKNFHENVVIQENRQSDIPWRIRTNICKQYPTDNQNVKLHKPKRYKNTS